MASNETIRRTLLARGQPGAAERYSTADVSPPNTLPSSGFLTPDELRGFAGSTDRQRAAARLREQASEASQQLARAKARRDREDIRRYERIVAYSNETATSIESGTGAISSEEAVRAARARDPDAKKDYLKRRYGSQEVRERARQDLREDKAAQAAGFGSYRDMKEAQSAESKQAAIDQRNRFIASNREIPGAYGRYVTEKRGYSPSTAPEERRAAQIALVKSGQAELIDPATNRPFVQQPGGIIVSVRTKEEAQAERERTRPTEQEQIPRVVTPTSSSIPSSRSDYTRGRGMISAAPENTEEVKLFEFIPLGGLRRGNERASAQSLSQTATQYRDVDYAKSSTASVKAFGVGFMQGSYNLLFKTGTTAKAFAESLFVHPVESTKELGSAIGTAPESTAGELLAYRAGFKTTGELATVATDAAVAGVTKISPSYRPVVPGPGGTEVIKDIPTSAGPKEIQLAGRIGSESLPAEPVSVAAARAGTTVDAVSGARDLFKPLRNEVKVDKPLPTPESPPLERSFFADPEARLRPTRLGLTQEQRPATMQDILTGDFSTGRSRPQAIILPETPVENFPANLRGVQQKLLRNEPLTPSEQAALLDFQLTPSGKAKPVGFLSTEPEVTVAPGETLRRVPGQGGVTLLEQQGSLIPRRVPIIQAEIVQTATGKNPASPTTTAVTSTTDLSSNLKTSPYLSPARAVSPISSLAVTNSPTISDSPVSSPPPSTAPSAAPSVTPVSSGTTTSAIFKPSPVSPRAPQYDRRKSIQPSPSLIADSPTYADAPQPTPSTTPAPRVTPPPFKIDTTPPPYNPNPRKEKERLKNEALYDVESRSRAGGEFYTFSTQGLRLEEAVSFAQGLVDTTAKASFKITERGTGRPIQGNTRSRAESLLTPGRFTKSKANEDVFVEKSQFRINTPGEKSEIKPKGLFSNSGKSRGRLIWA
jgi:hypothetical protein